MNPKPAPVAGPLSGLLAGLSSDWVWGTSEPSLEPRVPCDLGAAQVWRSVPRTQVNGGSASTLGSWVLYP